jgi:hypothetical protein
MIRILQQCVNIKIKTIYFVDPFAAPITIRNCKNSLAKFKPLLHRLDAANSVIKLILQDNC